MVMPLKTLKIMKSDEIKNIDYYQLPFIDTNQFL